LAGSRRLDDGRGACVALHCRRVDRSPAAPHILERVLRLYGIPIAPNDARALVAALIAYATPDAEAAAERISGGLEQGGNGLVALEPAHRDAILMCLDDPPPGLVELRFVLADDAAHRHGFA
jgi:hypothetical protein